MNKYRSILLAFVAVLLFTGFQVQVRPESIDTPFHEWSRDYALNILNESPWSQHQTYIRQLRGIGSGIQGEKEIYNTYFVRFLSAEPVRKAFARVKELHVDYDELDERQREEFDNQNNRAVKLKMDDWIVVSVAFRSNVPREESNIERFLMGQTTETIKTRVYLSTERFPRLEISEYVPPTEKIIGAKFIFPRTKDGREVVTAEDEVIAFEFDTPGSDSELRTTFDVQDMTQEGELIL